MTISPLAGVPVWTDLPETVAGAITEGRRVLVVDSPGAVAAAARIGVVAWQWSDPPPNGDSLQGFAGADVALWARKEGEAARGCYQIYCALRSAGVSVAALDGRGADTLAEHVNKKFTLAEAVQIDVDDLARRAGVDPGLLTPTPSMNGNGNHPNPVASPPVGDHDLPWPVMGEAAFYGLAGRIVRAVEPYTEADPAAVLLTLLTGFGNAVSSGPGLWADSAWHPGRLFVCVVGATAKARKGTSWRVVARLLEVADQGWLRDRVKSGLSSGEGLIAAVADPVANDDGTTAMAGVTDKRLLIIEEEFSRVLQVAKREASTLSAIIRLAYDSGDLSVLTKTAQRATGAHISIIGHITTEELRAKLTETDIANGLANRFMFVCATRSKRLANAAQLNQTTVNQLGGELGKALHDARPVGTAARTPAANNLWTVLYDEMADDDPGGLLGAIIARPEPITLRLALVYALLDGRDTIDVAHLQAAWAVWSYCRASAEWIFGDAIGEADADKLLEAIRHAGPGGLDATDQSKIFGRNKKAADLERLRDRLERAGKIITRPEPGEAGRPRQVSYDTRFAQEHTR